MVGAEDGKVLWLDVINVGLVDNTNAAARHVAETSSVDGRWWGTAAAGFAGSISKVGATVVAGVVRRPGLVAPDFDDCARSRW